MIRTTLLVCVCLAWASCSDETAVVAGTPIDEAPNAPARSPQSAANAASVEAPAEKTDELPDAGLAPQRIELVEIAFASASAMPSDPHVKSRAMAQSWVVETCLELDLPRRAHEYARQIENWRRGVAYADLAMHYIRRGRKGELVDHFLDRAVVESEVPEEEIKQSWRRDRIKSRLAQAFAMLGETATAGMFMQDLEDSEAAKVAAFEASKAVEEQFQPLMDVLERAVEIGDFDKILYALDASEALYERFYADADKRAQIERAVEKFWRSAPFALRVDVQLEFVDTALEAGDREHALELLEAAQRTIGEANWSAADLATVVGRMAPQCARLGLTEKSAQCFEQALAKYEAEREQIWDFERGEVLRPLAEARQRMGDAAGAAELYRLTVQEGSTNPNARTRSEDLTATCCSMARAGFTPDAETMKRLRALRDGLAAPW